MDIPELNLSPRERRALQNMGFSSVDKIALCYKDDVGLANAAG
jgi:hypothetical protein